jgi:hypothetical protein
MSEVAPAAARLRLEVEPMDLGSEVRAIGLELVEPADGEPARGAEAARVWARVLAALAGSESWALDFFSHLDRVREYCSAHAIAWRDAAARALVVPAPSESALEALCARFERETFGARAGRRLEEPDTALEGELARRGVDAYHHAYEPYWFCAVCDFENGWLTVLSRQISSAEVLRRIGPAVGELGVEIVRPA